MGDKAPPANITRTEKREAMDHHLVAKTLRKSQENLKKAEKIAKLGNWEWNINTNELLWSDEVYRIYGADPLKDSPSYDIVVNTVAPECRDRFVQAVKDAVEQGRHFDGEYRMIGLDGIERFTHTTGEVVRDGEGRPLSMFGIVQDITERKRMEESLHRTSQVLGAVVRHSPLAIICTDVDGNIMMWNPAAERIFGWSEQETLGTFNPIIPPEKVEEYRGLLEQVRCGRPYRSRELERRRKDGSRIMLSASSAALYDYDGVVVGLAGMFEDITERKQAADRLSEQNTKLQTLIHAIPDQVFFKDSQGRYALVNKAMEESLGIKAEAFVGMTDDELSPPEIAEKCKQSDAEAIRRGGPIYADEYYTDKNGVTRFLDVVKAPIYDTKGGLQGLVVVSRDITARKEAEEKLHRSDQFVRNILDTVDEGFVVIDRDYRIVTANKGYCGQAGLACNDVIGRHCFEISHKAARPCYEEGEDCAVRHVFATGEPHGVLHKHRDQAGNILYVETKAFPIKDNEGRVTSAIETVHNITEKHLLEQERLKTQKLESIGTLAGGIAHDFNNLLQGIFGFISLAKAALTDREKAGAMLEQAEKALQQSVSLTTQLLTFSKGGKPVRKPVSLPVTVENAVKFALSGSRLDYRIHIDRELRPVEADEGQLGQVIQNIVLNADQAMPLGGTLEIGARNVSARDPDLPQELKGGDYVAVSIRDTGIGIPENILPRIFDPYFTTKEKGSGLGLATSYSIIRNHEGMIDVSSEAGQGSVFTLYLPAAPAASVPPLSPETTAPSARKGRILVMDDEEIVRLVAGALIRSLGHEADFSEHGSDAIEKYRTARDTGRPYDVVILDLTVRGGMGGLDALRGLRELDPQVTAVVSSGYSDDAVTAEYETHGFRAFLKKPYDAEDLGNMLSSFLS